MKTRTDARIVLATPRAAIGEALALCMRVCWEGVTDERERLGIAADHIIESLGRYGYEIADKR